MPKPAGVELSWRDENYGSVCAASAFRNYGDTFDWSERAHQRFRGACKRAGYEFNYSRCSWIARQDGAADALCHRLEAAGFEITRGREVGREAA